VSSASCEAAEPPVKGSSRIVGVRGMLQSYSQFGQK
jgi:hypothetical protein